MIAAMTPFRWTIAGWVFLAVTVVLAVLAAVQALDAVGGGDSVQPYVTGSGVAGSADHDAAVEFLRGVICGVLAGAAFLAGIACFFWSALLDSRQQMARLLESLLARN